MAADTLWRSARIGLPGSRARVLFGRMYEDAEIERRAIPAGGRVFCIASAGCTAMRLSLENEVTAVDINPAQLAYAEQRAAGGSIQLGAAERLMQMSRRVYPLLGWKHDRICAFVAMEDVRKQSEFWAKYLDTIRFRAAFDGFMSRAVLRMGYAAGFLDGMPAHIGLTLRARMERCWALHANKGNRYARMFLLGEGAAENEEPLDLKRTGKIRFACADAATYLEGCARGSFDAFTLSNIFDGATESYRRRVRAAVGHSAAKGAVVILRSFSEPHSLTVSNCAAQDRAMLWGIAEVMEAERFAAEN